ncbi:GntR family transcriptional regulator [Aneurinibacillus danicus]|uniref:GntR family transcriptional regulator n=1 Tax=Aneurinibacillus danicus TaxID=267746 RepID=A0A511V1D4_9BACL|nr:GntR family transcriptional regulator [Aneurinibacillus danicus]GEN32726.1 GntR family transcriptional regulator [Aneurinibacillus danicus]
MIIINERSPLPIYEQIVQQMKEAILKGVLQGGEKLPSVRELSANLLVNPNTVSKAYQELERHGVIETLRGKGTFVSRHPVPRMEQERLEQFQNSLRQLAIEAFYLGIDAEQFKQWVDEYMKELGREKHA